MTIKHASYHEREDAIKVLKRPLKNREDRTLRNALKSVDVDALEDFDDDIINEDLKWK